MKYKVFFVALLASAIFLRFWRLGDFPPSLTWDEAAIGYNAYGLVSVHRDEWLNRTPLSFKSFGDYKSPLGIYLTTIPVALLGLTPLAVRLPVAVLGVGVVVTGYFLTKEILAQSEMKITSEIKEKISLFVMALLAISPWALHFSMIAFESTIATFFVLVGCLGLLKLTGKWWWVVVSGVSFSLSLYAYHSAKIVVPLLILTLLLLFRRQMFKRISRVILFFAVCGLVTLPLVYVSLFGKASERLYSSTILTDENRALHPIPIIVGKFISGFVSHLRPDYLFLGKEITYRQTNGRDGILSPLEGVLILGGIVILLRGKKYQSLRWLVLPIAISIVPAALGVDTPHANRSLLGLFWWQMLAGVGLLGILPALEKLAQNSQIKAIAALLLGLVVALSLAWHLGNDRRAYENSEVLVELQYGYKEVIEFVRSYESQVDRVFFTNDYGQAYIFLLFYKKMNPMEFRGGGLANYVITDNPWKDGAGSKRVLIVGSSTDFPEQIQGIKDINYPDGKLAFRVVKIE